MLQTAIVTFERPSTRCVSHGRNLGFSVPAASSARATLTTLAHLRFHSGSGEPTIVDLVSVVHVADRRVLILGSQRLERVVKPCERPRRC